ncbi:MAG: hypothetical protein KAX18_02665, partial [Candidatus Lokiarchaeota archaeon]|nr:hypothetical protein [Candidatus Lokiarchaeota archaeon]
WIQLQEWNDPDWIVLSRYTSGINFFWTHSVLLYLDRIDDRKKNMHILWMGVSNWFSTINY